MMLSGNLSDWSVGDLLQMLHITKKTASLHVEGTDRYGVVHFEDGAIVNADVSLGGGAARNPRDEVVEAVYVLELLDEGTFEIKGEVPSRMIDPISVSEALELAGEYLAAEKHLDETGLLAARALRLAQNIDEPIILSEQVWGAISGSIPAFTFPELEERMGRAAAVATVEQFRELGILEAVLDEPDPVEATLPSNQPAETVDPGSDDWSFGADSAHAFPGHVETPGPQGTDETSVAQAPSVVVEHDAPMTEIHRADHVEASTGAYIPDGGASDDGMIVPVNAEEMRPIVSDAPENDIVVAAAEEPTPEASSTEDHEPDTPEPASVVGATSLSAAIRAAAGAAADEGETAPDFAEGEFERSEDPTPAGISDQAEDGSLRRTVRSLVSEPKSPLDNGMLGDLGSKIRQAAAADRNE